MSKVEDFLSKTEEEEIVLAIKKAERNTSGEIRVHIEATSDIAHYDRTLEVFRLLKMFETKQRNAVLIYIAVEDHKFVIYGDEGINDVVPPNFWDTTKNIIQSNFQQQQFKEGIIKGILQIGEELKSHFPWNEEDIDELPNTISKN